MGINKICGVVIPLQYYVACRKLDTAYDGEATLDQNRDNKPTNVSIPNFERNISSTMNSQVLFTNDKKQ